MKKLITRSCEEIMTTMYKPIEFVIDGLLAQGLYILAGTPKVGKSWLALDMCNVLSQPSNKRSGSQRLHTRKVRDRFSVQAN